MSHADTIRSAIENDYTTVGAKLGHEALNALVEENDRLRNALEGWLLFVMEYIADSEASAHIAANEELAVLTSDRTPSNHD